MSTPYASVSALQTPQTEPARPDQARNGAGGYVWELSPWDRLTRFLVLGSDSPTYYASAKTLTTQNVAVIGECLDLDPKRTVDAIVEVSASGRAPKNSPALLALAIASAHPTAKHDALGRLGEVARTGTHLFEWLGYVEQQRRWGPTLRRAVGAWYTNRTPESLALQLVKYRQRAGWTHRDALRLAHPKVGAEHPLHSAVRFAVQKFDDSDRGTAPLIDAYLEAQASTSAKKWVELVSSHGLPWEALPDAALGHAEVWDALYESIGLTAVLRNLGRVSALGASRALRSAVRRLVDADALKLARIHPLSVLVALNTYASGRGARGALSWTPDRQVVDALDETFYLSFGSITGTGKRTLLALDVSGSMSGPDLSGMLGISPRVGSAAMAMVTARVESDWMCVAFSGGLTPLSISPRQRLDDVVRSISGLPFDRTDCALPIAWATRARALVDTFVVYTDSETWAGTVHPFQALRQYRQASGIDAKLVVVGMTSTGFSIADPSDPGMLDVVGFDSAAPEVISSFARGYSQVQ